MKKWLVSVLAAAFAFTGAAGPAAAFSAPYESYTYNYYLDAVPIPAPYLPDRAVTGRDLGVGDFRSPNDLFVAKDGTLYILDSGNARIIVLDPGWKPVRVIGSFMRDGREDRLLNPGGIHVTEDGLIYVADTDNRRVVVLDGEGRFVRLLENPQSDILPPNFIFNPLKLTVDSAGRVYVVSRGAFEGIMQFDSDGTFIGYVGTIHVRQSIFDKIWLRLATREQRARMQLYIPTEFSNLDIDDKDFIYATNIDTYSDELIKRLNPSGQDVLKRFGYYPVRGDVRYRNFGSSAGPSMFVDIKYLGGGMYTGLDAKRGRLFTYNDEGDLLYVFGALGTQVGTFTVPVAVERQGMDILVLDRAKSNITVFKPTRFGRLVNEATRLHYDGYSTAAVALWREVLALNSNYDAAYIGIGKSLLLEKRNEEAMEYFKLGMKRRDYSVAFKRYRKEVLQAQFGPVMSAIVALVAAWLAFRVFRRRRMRRVVNHEARLH